MKWIFYHLICTVTATALFKLMSKSHELIFQLSLTFFSFLKEELNHVKWRNTDVVVGLRQHDEMGDTHKGRAGIKAKTLFLLSGLEKSTRKHPIINNPS